MKTKHELIKRLKVALEEAMQYCETKQEQGKYFGCQVPGASWCEWKRLIKSSIPATKRNNGIVMLRERKEK